MNRGNTGSDNGVSIPGLASDSKSFKIWTKRWQDWCSPQTSLAVMLRFRRLDFQVCIVVGQVDIAPLQRPYLRWNTKANQAVECPNPSHRRILALVDYSIEGNKINVVKAIRVRVNRGGDALKRVVRQHLGVDAVLENLPTNTDPATDRVEVQCCSRLGITFLRLPLSFSQIALQFQPLSETPSPLPW